MIKIVSFYIVTRGCQYLKTQLERIKNSLQKTFKDFGLEIVAESNFFSRYTLRLCIMLWWLLRHEYIYKPLCNLKCSTLVEM